MAEDEKTHSSIKLFHMIKELESNYECQRENNNESISNINQMFLKQKDKIETLETWKDKSWNMHQQMAQDILPDQIERLEKQISELGKRLAECEISSSELKEKVEMVNNRIQIFIEDTDEKKET